MGPGTWREGINKAITKKSEQLKGNWSIKLNHFYIAAYRLNIHVSIFFLYFWFNVASEEK